MSLNYQQLLDTSINYLQTSKSRLLDMSENGLQVQNPRLLDTSEKGLQVQNPGSLTRAKTVSTFKSRLLVTSGNCLQVDCAPPRHVVILIRKCIVMSPSGLCSASSCGGFDPTMCAMSQSGLCSASLYVVDLIRLCVVTSQSGLCSASSYVVVLIRQCVSWFKVDRDPPLHMVVMIRQYLAISRSG